MNKQELIEIVADQNNITKALAGRILNSFTDTIIDAVKRDEKVVLVGFGSFFQTQRQARNARNPLTKEILTVPENRRPKFVPGSVFRSAVDPEFRTYANGRRRRDEDAEDL